MTYVIVAAQLNRSRSDVSDLDAAYGCKELSWAGSYPGVDGRKPEMPVGKPALRSISLAISASRAGRGIGL